MTIRNKLESIKAINDLGLNKFKEALFKANEEEKVLEFISNNKANYYAIRDKSKSGGIFKLKVPFEDVLEEIKGYEVFTINVSSINYADNQVLTGEVCFLSNGSVYLTASTDKYASARFATINPSINIKTTIFDNRVLNTIPSFDLLYKYAIKNKLIDVIIEFGLFDKEVEINNEKIIIYELRTDY